MMQQFVWVEDLMRELPGLVALGVRDIGLPARVDRPTSELEALAEAGVVVVAVRLEADLTAPDLETRRHQLHLCQRQLADAALLGATEAWLSTPELSDDAARARFDEAFALLVEFARARQIDLRRLPTSLLR